MTLLVRRTTPSDHPAAVEVWRAALAGAGSRPPALRAARVADKLTEGLLVVADDDGEVVGMALGEPDRHAADRLHVSMVFVVPGRWRIGVGSALLEGLADEAWGQGSRRLSVWTREANAPARALCEACGLQQMEAGVLADGSAAIRYEGELEAPVRDVAVFSDGIRLGQFLKLAELVDTGAQAKLLLADGGVQVNGQADYRRGRQLVEGDLVTARDSAVRVHLPR